MSRPRRPKSLAFADTVVRCPRCPSQLKYYGKPDWVGVLRDGKTVRLRCPNCKRKYDLNVKPGITAAEDERSVTEVRN